MIKIITDSTCDIPQNLLEQHNISVIPQLVIWGEEQYRDHIDLSPEDFYKRLETDTVMPHSSQPSLPTFVDAYQSAMDEGAQHIIMLTVSAAMSGTFNMANQAAREIDIPVTVIDSKGPTMSLGWQTLAAARAAEAGLSVNEIIESIAQVRSKLVQLVGMTTLKYLQTGGRIGKAIKWAGTILNVKPLVSINHESGLVEPVGLARSGKNLISMLYRDFFKRIGEGTKMRIAVLHGNAQQKAEELAQRIKDEFDPVELLINTTGPVLGINTGPGALALCGYTED